jgi:hypothetical protein
MCVHDGRFVCWIGIRIIGFALMAANDLEGV